MTAKTLRPWHFIIGWEMFREHHDRGCLVCGITPDQTVRRIADVLTVLPAVSEERDDGYRWAT